MKDNLYKKILESKEYIEKKLIKKPRIGLILGSGLGVLGDEVEDRIEIEYSQIPYFPVSTVEGHKGRFVFGELEGADVAVMQGRFHFYEGYSMPKIVFPVWVMKALGIEKLIVTNAAGGINTSFNAGDLMIIKNHINYTGINPLIGENLDEFGPRFPDMSSAYSIRMIDIAKECSKKYGIRIKEGVYIFMSGPSYETPAEIRAARILGADAVGMSTVPEVIAARHAGMEILGISCITNMAAGVLDRPLSHEEVISTAETVKYTFIKLVKSIVKEI